MKLNALDLLVADPADATSAIKDALTTTGVIDEMPDGVPPLAPPAAKFLLGAVAGALQSMLAEIGIDEMLMGGWSKLDSLVTARKVTAEDHGERHVSLLEHEITSHHEPRVEMLVDERPIPLMHLRLNAAFVVDAAALLVRDGIIAEATPAKVSAKAELKCGDVKVLEHAVPALDVSRLFAAARS